MKQLILSLFVICLSAPHAFADDKVSNAPESSMVSGTTIISSPMDEPLTEVAAVDTEVSFTATHPLLKLSPDKSELIRLSGEAASVIVGNPNHISVLLDTPDTIIVIPRAQGASHFSVVDDKGDIIMQRHVVVATANDNYVRIRRSCNANARDCQPTSVYFCPNMCHEVQEASSGTRR